MSVQSISRRGARPYKIVAKEPDTLTLGLLEVDLLSVSVAFAFDARLRHPIMTPSQYIAGIDGDRRVLRAFEDYL